MPRRVTLTDRQREALLHLPVDQGELLRHYTLSDEDLGHIPMEEDPQRSAAAVLNFLTQLPAGDN